MVIKRYQVVLSICLLLPIQSAWANQDCFDKTCVDVFTENNQLIITASKNGAKPTPAPSKKAFVKPKPVESKKSVPKPIIKSAPPKKVSPVKAKPKAAPAKKLSTTSLSDRLIKLLPVGDINFQPENDALVNLPVYFWTQTPQR
ncbi:MAG: hypothetical protein ACOVKH_05585, partial [Candidatus Nanopelagicus sp.]